MPPRLPNEQAEPSGERWRWLAAGAVIALAAVVGCNKVWSEDVFWHLKSGQWMLEHRSVLGHDPFSVDGPDRWVNVHWGFQVLVAAVHWIGGFAGLVLLKMGAFAGIAAVLVLALRRRIGPAWLMLSGLWLVLAIETRIRVRPESLTYLLLMGTLVLVDSVRRGARPRRLWWLVPINVVWVNVHGVYVVGIASVWLALGGAAIDRLLKRPTAGGLATTGALLPVVAATAACLVSPWPLDAALHPLLLQQRVSGQEQLYTYGVQELRPTYLVNPFRTVPLLINLVLAVAVLELLQMRRRHVATGEALWFAAFLVGGLLALRNIALFSIPAALLLAGHGGQWASEFTARHRVLARLGVPVRGALLVLLAVVAAGYATEWVYRVQRRPANRFGFGLVEGIHPIALARWLGESQLSGDILPVEFGHGGVFICYSYPRRKVWIDGRLEVQPMWRLEKLYEYRALMLSAQAAADPRQLVLPETVRFVVLSSQDSGQIQALSTCQDRFRLVYLDPAAACFARLPVPGEQNAALLSAWDSHEPLPPTNLNDYDKPLDPARRQALLDVPTRRTWYRQNVSSAHWQFGCLLHALGQEALAVRYLIAADRLGLERPIHRAGMLAEAHQALAAYQPVSPEFEPCDLPVDPNMARALALYEGMDLTNLSDPAVRQYALRRLYALLFDRHIDAAREAMDQYRRDLPIPDRWYLPDGERRLADHIQEREAASRAKAEQFGLPGLDAAQRAYLLTREDVGLTETAIAVLRAEPNLPPRSRLLLGDLYLRRGLVARARKEYAAAAPDKPDWNARMREGLCAWAEGNLAEALAALSEAARSAPSAPEPLVYLALLHEQLGNYAAAGETLARFVPGEPRTTENQAVRLLGQIAARLRSSGHEPPEGPLTRPAGGL